MNKLLHPFRCFLEIIDSDHFAGGAEAQLQRPDRFYFRYFVVFLILHLGCLGVIWVGWSPIAAITAVALYFVRMFFITGFYHRYFCHKSYSVSRPMQFFMALCGLTCAQRGPLWWASVHRHHHAHSDDEEDFHSPTVRGFLWAHIGWLTSAKNYPTNYRMVRDFKDYPEIRFLNRFDLIGPLLLLGLLFAFGSALQAWAPGLGTNGWQMVVWGFFISTSLLFHGTCAINSFTHMIGTRRYKTGDDSRNSFILALVTLGEGWHNNHHRFQRSARQGFYWWEIDITYYTLKALEAVGLVRDLKPVPPEAYEEAALAQKSKAA
jgi:stearoyl-CoA desaturase (delta-9 desaturase)